jgi:hypothetical protein
VLVIGQQLAEPAHQRAAYRGGGDPPSRKRLRGIGDRALGQFRCGLSHREQDVAGDRRACRQAMLAGLAERDVAADCVQRPAYAGA